MDKKLLEALSARAEQRDEAKRKGAKFYVAGEELDFVQPGVDVKLSYAEALNSGDTAALLRSCANVIYDCCPALQEPELRRGRRKPQKTRNARPGARPCGVLRAAGHSAGRGARDVPRGQGGAARRPGALLRGDAVDDGGRNRGRIHAAGRGGE